MIGWSWVLVTDTWLLNAGTLGTLIAFAFGGLAIALIGLTYSELASAMPRAGGEHIYTLRALGPRWSFVCTWALLFAYVNVCLFEAVALPTAVSYLLPEIRMQTLWQFMGADVHLGFVLIGAAGAITMTWLNFIGIRTAAIAQTMVTLLIFACGALLVTGKAKPTAAEISTYHNTAQTTDRTSRRPIRCGGRSISSADCGITSKPTNIAGTIITTAKMPVAGLAIHGSALAADP